MKIILAFGFDIEFFGVPQSQIPFVQEEILESTWNLNNIKLKNKILYTP